MGRARSKRGKNEKGKHHRGNVVVHEDNINIKGTGLS
jgi:hypothetical protein